MAGTFRFAPNNLLLTPADPNLGATVLSASSYDPSLPPSFLLDQLRSKPWRSKSGYNITTEFNDRIDFVEGGVARVASLAVANYASGTAMASQAQTAINAAAVSNTYTVTYNTSTKKFTVARATGSATISLPWITGTNKDRGAGRCLGFTADDTGATSYTSDEATYHSREWVQLYLPMNGQAEVVFVSDHNVTNDTAGTIQLQATSTLPFTLTGNPVDQALTGTGTNPRHVAFTLSGKLYWRIVFNDWGNSDAFSECGTWFLSDMQIPSIRPSINSQEVRDELSVIAQAIDGAHHVDTRPKRMVHPLDWTDVTDADRTIIEGTQDDHPPGSCMWINFNSDDISDSAYGYWADGLQFSYATPTLWNISGTFVEALG